MLTDEYKRGHMAARAVIEQQKSEWLGMASSLGSCSQAAWYRLQASTLDIVLNRMVRWALPHD